MSLSDFRLSPTCLSRGFGWLLPDSRQGGSLVFALASPCRVPSSLPRRVPRPQDRSGVPWTTAFPLWLEGRHSRLTFSGPARRSLTLWPASSQNCLKQPFASKALAGLSPPQRLRLLLVGTIRYQRGSRTHRTTNTDTTHSRARSKRSFAAPLTSLIPSYFSRSPRGVF
jgi:hypothetical protein